MSSTIKKQRGFTLMETLVYASGLILLLGAMLTLLSATYNWYRTVVIGSRVDQVGTTLTDRIERDIRTGKNTDSANSLFATTTGSITINTFNDSILTVKKYTLTNGRITYQENGITQYLSPSDINITRFYLTDILTGVSEAVKFDIDISYATKTGLVTRTYSDVVILRNSY